MVKILGIPGFRDMSKFSGAIQNAGGKIMVLPGHVGHYNTSIDFTIHHIQDEVIQLLEENTTIEHIIAYSFSAHAALGVKSILENTGKKLELTLVNPALNVMQAVSNMSSWVENQIISSRDIMNPSRDDLLERLVQSERLGKGNAVLGNPSNFRADLKKYGDKNLTFSQLGTGVTCFINPFDAIIFEDGEVPKEGVQENGSIVKYLPGAEVSADKILLGHMINRKQGADITRYLEQLS